MKSYPQTIRCSPGSTSKVKDVYVFDKLDGSNLRFEWTSKKGWHKFGTRKRLFDTTDKVFGKAISIFMEVLADDLEKVIKKQRWRHVVAFAEFFGPHSFAGHHRQNDAHTLSLIDLAADKKGLLDPRDYIKVVYPHVKSAEYLGRENWNEDLVKRVLESTYPGVTFEGVVGKYVDRKRVILLKAKSQAWKDRVKEKLGDQAKKILES